MENDRAEVKSCALSSSFNMMQTVYYNKGLYCLNCIIFIAVSHYAAALRNRKRDIRTLFIHFVKIRLRLGKETPEFIDEYIYKLEEHTWHNNRELKHVAELYAIGMVDTLSKQADKSVAPVSGDLMKC
ncbi:hypothetical protein PCI56_03240 [Plesiomonas shigelloides subsp. oncorhynchi]|nr:hypothetical protein [Plesiomonas shigelloides]